MKRQIGAIACVLAVLAVAGCREFEQDRILSYEPGVYQGPEDQSLDEDTLRALNQRAWTGQTTQ